MAYSPDSQSKLDNAQCNPFQILKSQKGLLTQWPKKDIRDQINLISDLGLDFTQTDTWTK